MPPLTGRVMPAVPKSQTYSKEEWDAKKPIIERLWHTEDRPWISKIRPTQSVEYILRYEHSFIITRKQFMRKIKEWGLYKNVKKKEMRKIDQIARQRKLTEKKDTEVIVRGRGLSTAKLQRWRNRQIVLEEGLDSKDSTSSLVPKSTQDSPIPSDVIFKTPSALSPLDSKIADDLHGPLGIELPVTMASRVDMKNISSNIDLVDSVVSKSPDMQLPTQQLPADTMARWLTDPNENWVSISKEPSSSHVVRWVNRKGKIQKSLTSESTSVGNWLRDNMSSFSYKTPSQHSSSRLPPLDSAFMGDFTCCGTAMPTMHDLLEHYRLSHAQQQTDTSSDIHQNEQNVGNSDPQVKDD